MWKIWRQCSPKRWKTTWQIKLFYEFSNQGFTDMYKWICLMTVNSPQEQNKTRPASPPPFQRNKFSQSFSVSRGRVPRHRPIRTSPMSDFLYSPATATHVPASPYSSFFGSNDKTETRSNENKLLLSPTSTSTRTSKIWIKHHSYNGRYSLNYSNICT